MIHSLNGVQAPVLVGMCRLEVKIPFDSQGVGVMVGNRADCERQIAKLRQTEDEQRLVLTFIDAQLNGETLLVIVAVIALTVHLIKFEQWWLMLALMILIRQAYKRIRTMVELSECARKELEETVEMINRLQKKREYLPVLNGEENQEQQPKYPQGE